jgi:hypothetical protein
LTEQQRIFLRFPKKEERHRLLFCGECKNRLFIHGVDAASYHLNRLNARVFNAYEKARLLLLSQCENGISLVLPAAADWIIIGNVILMLTRDKDGHANVAGHFGR